LWQPCLSQNHPFVDGNKRTAFAGAYTFLAINGLQISATDSVAQDYILSLYESGEVNFEVLRKWLESNMVSIARKSLPCALLQASYLRSNDRSFSAA
jgi:death-on-curing protein